MNDTFDPEEYADKYRDDSWPDCLARLHCDLQAEITRLRAELSAAHLGMAAVKEQAAAAITAKAEEMRAFIKKQSGAYMQMEDQGHSYTKISAFEEAANFIRALPLPPSDSLARVRELVEAARQVVRSTSAFEYVEGIAVAKAYIDPAFEEVAKLEAALSALEPLIGKPQT